MKLISWNVNGLRACVGKNFMEDFKKLDADIFCLQFIVELLLLWMIDDISSGIKDKSVSLGPYRTLVAQFTDRTVIQIDKENAFFLRDHF